MAYATLQPTQADRRYARRDAADDRAAQRTLDREQAARDAIEWSSTAGMPTLIGTDKQCSWAVTLRRTLATVLASAVNRADDAELAHAGMSCILFGIPYAAWYIDHRDATTDSDTADALLADWAAIAQIARDA